VWVSCWRLASDAETKGKGDAGQWWRRAYELLQGMKDKGMFVSPEDLGYLEVLRGKVGEK
jgi:hypothetical protein